MAHYAVVNVLAYRDGKVYYSEDDNTWSEVTPESITGYPKQGEMVVWFAGPGIEKITSIDFVDQEDFSQLPSPQFDGKFWYGKIKPDAVIGDEPKYTITVEVNGQPIEIDPKLRVEGDG